MDKGGTTHTAAVIVTPASDKIVFAVKEPGINYLYLTDESRLLIGAGISDGVTLRIISVDDALPGYQLPLRAWGAEFNE